jgi:transcriptional regulator with XRE-family HTH domain
MDDQLAKTIGAAARAARRARGLTQEDAADAADVSLEFYSRIERGKTLPSVPTLLRLATTLQVSADVLLGLDRRTRDDRTSTRSTSPPIASATRKLMRRVQRARPSTIRVLNLLLREFDNRKR